MVLGQNAKRALGATCVGAGVVALHVGAGLFFASHDPYTTTVFPPCPFLAITGWQCPGCGGTRAAYSLFHGDIMTSLKMNPLVISGYLAGASLSGMVLAEWASRPRVAAVLGRVAIVIVIAAVVYGVIVRNLLPPLY